MRTAIERDHARLVHHFVADGYEAGALCNVVRVPVDRGHHGPGQTARDAPYVERQILRTIERSGVVSVAAASRRAYRGGSLLRVVCGRRDPAVLRIGDHPRPAVLRVVVLVPMRRTSAGVVVRRAPNRLRGFLLTLGALFDEPIEVCGSVIFLPLAGKLRRLLHWNATFVAVRVGSLEVWITPWGPWDGRRLRRAWGGGCLCLSPHAGRGTEREPHHEPGDGARAR